YPGAELRAADIGEMFALGSFPETRVLPLDEVADVQAAREGRARPQTRERPDVALRSDQRMIDDAVRKHLGAGADLAVADEAAGADAYAVAEHHASLEHHVHVEEYVLAMCDGAAHVDSRGIGQRDSREHELLGRLRPPRGLEPGGR